MLNQILYNCTCDVRAKRTNNIRLKNKKSDENNLDGRK